MPKETIFTDDPTEPIVGPYTVETDNNLVDVTWGKGLGHVQIGVRERNHLPGDRETGHYSTLSDRQIDELIRALRKAKRQAYPEPAECAESKLA